MKKIIGSALLLSSLSLALTQQAHAVTEGHNASIGIVEALSVTETQALNFGSYVRPAAGSANGFVTLWTNGALGLSSGLIVDPSVARSNGLTTIVGTGDSSINIKVTNFLVGTNNPANSSLLGMANFDFLTTGQPEGEDCEATAGCDFSIETDGSSDFVIGAFVSGISPTLGVGTHAFTYDVNVTYN